MANDFIVKSDYNDGVIAQIEAVMEAKFTAVLLGDPGLGKTALVEALSAVRGDDFFFKVMGNSMDPTDVVGLPVRYKNEQDVWVTAYAPPEWAVKANAAKSATIFFDELSTADPSIQAALLTLLHSRQIPNGPKIGDHVKFVAAANSAEMASNGYLFTPALANRLCHIQWAPPAEDWFKGMIRAWGHEVSEDETKFRSLIITYLKQNESMLQKVPSDMEEAGKAWPSRRSWDNLAKAYPRMGNVDSSFKDDLMRGIVGDEAAVGFNTFLSGFTLPDPSDVLDNPSIVNWADTTTGDKSYAVLNSVIAHGSKIRGEEVLDVLIFAAENGPVDIPASLVIDFIQSGYKAPDGKFPFRMMKHFAPALSAAGVYN